MRKVMQALSYIIILADIILLIYCFCHPYEAEDGTVLGKRYMVFGFASAFLPGLYYVSWYGSLTEDDREKLRGFYKPWFIVASSVVVVIDFFSPEIIRLLFKGGKLFSVLTSGAFRFLSLSILAHIYLLLTQKNYTKLLNQKQHEKDLLKTIRNNNQE